MKTTYSIDLNVAPEKVFHWLDDPKRVMQWVCNVEENENLHETEDKVGTKFRQIYVENGRRMEFHGTVTAYEENKRLAIEMQSKGFDLDVDYRLEKIAVGTRLTQNSQVHFKGLMKFIMPLFAPFMKKSGEKQLNEDFNKLKTLCENEAAGEA